MDCKGKTAVITGGSDGIGKATAMRLAKNKCNIVCIARNPDKLQKVRQELQKYDIKITTCECDISQAKKVNSTFEKINNEFGNIDYVVNCAGISTSQPIESLTEEGFNKEIDVNLKGTYYVIMAAYPLMKNGGAIVNVSSERGRSGSPTSSPGYSSSKAGVINLTKTFALQLAKHQIRVNAVAPGPIYETGMNKNWSPEKQLKVSNTLPLKRLGNPDDVAGPICFLLSPDASFITGQTLDVNGGIWMN